MLRVPRFIRHHGILALDQPPGVRGPDTHNHAITTAKADEMWSVDAAG
jgi:hypothetical protein